MACPKISSAKSPSPVCPLDADVSGRWRRWSAVPNSMCRSLNLILIFGVSVEECLDFQLVHPATQAASELSLDPKVKAAEPPSEEFKELFASLQKKVSDNMSQHSPNSPNAIAWQRNPALVRNRTIVGPVPHLPRADYMADRLSTLWIACLDHGNGPSLQASR
jgi:hypothetical protein